MVPPGGQSGNDILSTEVERNIMVSILKREHKKQTLGINESKILDFPCFFTS